MEFLEYLEANFSLEQNEISELIAVSFLEYLPFHLKEEHWAVSVLGPKLKKQYCHIYGCTS